IAHTAMVVTVQSNAYITANAQIHRVGGGSHPTTTVSSLGGILLAAYDTSNNSCARQQAAPGTVNWQAYPAIIANCTPYSTDVTDANGNATLNVIPGHNYVVLGQIDTNGDNVVDTIIDATVGNVSCGHSSTKYLRVIVDANGKAKPAKVTVLTGTQLLVIEPEYVIWDNTVQLYPFAFESEGDWGVTASVTPPQG